MISIQWIWVIMIKRFMLGSSDKLGQKIFFWNMVSSMLNAFTSVVLLIVVTRVGGETTAGIFSYAFASAQLMMTIGLYEIRPYQATDLKQKYTFNDYLNSRILTSLLMIVSSTVYIMYNVWSGSCPPDRIAIVFLMCLFKLIDVVEDVFHGQLQRKGRLDVAGKAMSIRILFSTTAFMVSFYLLQNLISATVIATVVGIVIFIICNLTIISEFASVQLTFCKKAVGSLFVVCFPLFAGSFMVNYIYNAPKFSINSIMPDEYQTYYNILFMPASVINLFSGFLLKPMLTTLAQTWLKKDYEKFKLIVFKLFYAVIGLTLLVVVVGYFLGIPVLSFIYSVDLSDYQWELVIALIGGGFSAMAIVLYYTITVIRRQQFILYGYLLVFIIALIFTPTMVEAGGIFGGVLIYMLLMILMSLVFLGILVFFVKKDTNPNKQDQKKPAKHK